MRIKKTILSNFTRTGFSEALCIRPQHERQLQQGLDQYKLSPILARGAGLSYSDGCFNTKGYVVDTQRFNHFIHFDESTGVVECQSAVTYKDLFLLHPQFIPPVFPGTAHATIAGGIANDVHGKNNHWESSFGKHILWIDLLIMDKRLRCSPKHHPELFQATIGGLGLTGIITSVGLQLKKASKQVKVTKLAFTSLSDLIGKMSTLGLDAHYQMAWLDLINKPTRGVLALANHTEEHAPQRRWIGKAVMPKVPFCVLQTWNLKLLNQCIFKKSTSEQLLSLQHFNNPLDSIRHWNRCYGNKGLIQFQALFSQAEADNIIKQLVHIIRLHQAIPTLAVLKLFTNPGRGLLSFCKPGFTLAIDFIGTPQAKQAILEMNQIITDLKGRVYLGKDLYLKKDQFETMYESHQQFKNILAQYQSPMQSDLSKRIGLLP
ncbi:MAG: FAD-binding oxidoreductase [Legionella sp.]|nr:FAD-binding oxidoreductase [Legionella sp.]